MPVPDRPSVDGAKEWLREKDHTVRIIAAEMAEYADRVRLLWGQAIDQLDSDPADSLAKLIDVEILLENHLRIEREDILEVATEGSERLAAALPDEDG